MTVPQNLKAVRVIPVMDDVFEYVGVGWGHRREHVSTGIFEPRGDLRIGNRKGWVST